MLTLAFRVDCIQTECCSYVALEAADSGEDGTGLTLLQVPVQFPLQTCQTPPANPDGYKLCWRS